MNARDHDDERPLAWTAILADTPVYAADGTDVGRVEEVVGSVDDDIFHGIQVGVGAEAREVLIPAQEVRSITNRRITVALNAEEVRTLPAYGVAESYELGFTGLMGRLGWKRERDDHP